MTDLLDRPRHHELLELVELVELDLRERPFTDRGSRLLVFRQDDGALWVTRAAYERPPARTAVLRDLRLYGPSGAELRVRAARPDRVAFEDGVNLVFTDPETLIVTGPPGVRATWTGSDGGHHDTLVAGYLPVVGTGPSTARRPAGLAALHAARVRWTSWFERVPPARADLRPMAALAWWTLAVNLLPIGAAGGREGLVPAKPGYLGVWNWDACFHAVALRHVDPRLARDQLRILLDHQLPDGQLPDVVHDTGVLAATSDLPRSDAARLAQHVGQALDRSAQPESAPDPAPDPVPVTKPPLLAWAAWKIHETDPDPAFLASVYPSLVHAHAWWLTVSDPDRDGLAEYLHPYSSGLDDSPVWDHGPSAEPPDLNAYLVHQADRLGDIAAVLGLAGEAEDWRAEAAARTELLVRHRWTGDRFTTLVGGRPVDVRTPLELLPLFTGRLPREIAARLVKELLSESFTGRYGIPSVAFDDPSFDPEAMWRGPVWLNINYLLIDALHRSGFPEEAALLTERCLRMVAEGGGLHEYWNPLTGRRADRATTGFGWSAALFVDLSHG